MKENKITIHDTQVNSTKSLYFNDIYLGFIYPEVDGFYVFSPHKDSGVVWSGHTLVEIGNIIKDLNKGWSDQIDAYFAKENEITDQEIFDAADNWVFTENPDKWSNNDDTCGDNFGSFIKGANWVTQRQKNGKPQTEDDNLDF